MNSLTLNFDLKIKREHLLSMGVHCTKFDKGSNDIERTSLGLQATDRLFQSCHKNGGPALTRNSANG